MEQTQSQKLPAGLAGVLNGPEEHRDSAYYSIDHTSKHNSTQSANGTVTTPSTDPSSTIEKTPSPISTGPNIQPLNSPASGGMSVASMVSPTSPTAPDNAMSRFSQHSYESGPNSVPFVNNDSRRESVDSRLGANFGDMRLANSPYASHNQSTTSLQSSLAQQRNPGSAVDRNSGPFRFSNGYQPQRQPDALSPRNTTRIAPTITGPALGNIARAPEPTKGQAWAFPEEEVQRLPSAARPSNENQNRQGTSFYDDSRRNSYAESIASSQYTTESRLPPGQRRLEDGMPSDFRLSRASSDFQGVSTHHHSLQHRQLSELQDDEGGSPGSSQPYSRTPELRVSHKLAERKRRTEMKELFDTLNSRQHHDRGSKASKWEILTKAIAEDERKEALIKAQQEELQRFKAELQRKDRELELCTRELNNLRLEVTQMRAELHTHNAYHGAPQSTTPHGQPPQHGSAMNRYSNGHFERPSTQPDPRQGAVYNQRPAELPPIRGLNGPGAGPESMSGIQYQQHDPRPNGYGAGPDRF